MKLKNQVAIVTGASRGIGKAIALAFAKEGAKVLIHYKTRKQEAEKVYEEILKNGGEALIFSAEVSNRSSIDEMIKYAVSRWGRIDILVNNAGISNYKLFIDMTIQDWNEMIETHVTGTFHCTQSALRYMLQNHSGTIINISSIWGEVGASCEVHYSTAKGAIIAFTKALAKEMGPSGIYVNCITPGVIDTEMLQDLSPEDIQNLKDETPLGRIGSVEDVATLAVFLASKDASFITGQVISPNGGFVI